MAAVTALNLARGFAALDSTSNTTDITNPTDKYIGFGLAVGSSLFIGISFIMTKKGLIDSEGHGTGDSYSYLRSYIWWAGMITMIVGELANFAAYTFAPAILVTPLGALSVIISAILASLLLNEKLRVEGKAGCALCLIGSIIIVLHSPDEIEVQSINEFLAYATQPGFIVYSLLVLITSVYLIYRVAPTHGKKNMLIYITICSIVGSISVVSCKGFGLSLKLTFSGHNQFVYPSTYLFMCVVAVCVLTQMNYLNKALDIFSTALVTPIYYVFFTSATIIANVILFNGFNTASGVQVVSTLCGFFTIFIGVFLLQSPQVGAGSHASLSNGMGDLEKGIHMSVINPSGYRNPDDADLSSLNNIRRGSVQSDDFHRASVNEESLGLVGVDEN